MHSISNSVTIIKWSIEASKNQETGGQNQAHNIYWRTDALLVTTLSHCIKRVCAQAVI